MAKDFQNSIDNGYMVSTSIVVGDATPTDIRCVCDTVADFQTFFESTEFEIRYEGLVTYEKENSRLMVYDGTQWNEVGGAVEGLENYVTLERVQELIQEAALTGPAGPVGPQGPAGEPGVTSWNELQDKPDLSQYVLNENFNQVISETNTRLDAIQEQCTGGNGSQDHSHVNKLVIDKLDELDGELRYNGKKLASEIEDNSIAPEKTTFVTKRNDLTVNILNLTNSLKDVYLDTTTGEPSEKLGYYVTDFIEVKPETFYSRTNETTSYIDTAFYTADKELISGFYNTQALTFTTTADCKYIRTTVKEENLNTTMIVEGEELPIEYIPNEINVLNDIHTDATKLFGVLNQRNLPANVVLNENFRNLKIGRNQLSDDIVSQAGINVFNKEFGERGYLSTANGNIVVSTAVKDWSSDYIPCLPGEIYYKVGVSSNEVNDQDICFYDQSKQFISGYVMRKTDNSWRSFTIPERAYYFRFDMLEAYRDTEYVSLVNSRSNNMLSSEIGISTQNIRGEFKIGFDNLDNSLVNNLNVFDKDSGERGYLSVTNGIVSGTTTVKDWSSDYIPCLPGEIYYKVGVSSNEVNDQDICFYDQSKQFISGYVMRKTDNSWRSFTIPERAYYFRFDMLEAYRDTETVTLYEDADNIDHEAVVLPSNIKVHKKNVVGLGSNENNDEYEYYRQPYLYSEKGVKYSLNVNSDGTLYAVPGDLSHVPADMNKFIVTGLPSSEGDILVAPHTDNGSLGWLMVLDNNLCVKKYKKLTSFAYNFRKHKNSSGEVRYTYSQTVNKEHPKIPQNGGYDNTKLVVAGEDLETLYEHKLKAHGTVPEGYPGENHEYIYFDDNHYMMLAYVGATVDNIPGYEGSYKAVNCVIQEVKNDEVVFHWESIDHEELYTYSCCNKDFTNYPSTQNTHNDYHHMNSFMIDPTNENHLIVSARGLGLMKIDKTTGDILWMFGRGGRIDFDGMEQAHTPYLQHHATKLKDGSIICFDNSGCATNNVRICRYWLDEEAMTMTDFKQYITIHPRSPFMGSVDMIREDVFLINYGGAYRGVTFEEYDFNRRKQNMTFTFEDGTDCYRVWKDIKHQE